MELSPKERLLRAMCCQEIDRVPVRLWGVDPFVAGCTEPSSMPLYELAEQYCDQMVSWNPLNYIGTDADFGLNGSEELHRVVYERPSSHEGFIEKISIINTPEGELRSTYWKNIYGGPGRMMEYPLKSDQDLSAFLSIPWEPLRPPVDSFFELERRLDRRALPVADMAGDPIYHVYKLLGSELMAVWSIERRDLIRELMDVLTERWLDYVRYLAARKVGPVFSLLGPEVCIPPLQSVRDFEEFVVQVDSMAIDIIHDAGGIVWVHCHGKMDSVLERFIEMGVNCLNPIEAPPMGDILLSNAKRRVGGTMCIEGNVEVGYFETMTAKAFREVCIGAIQAGKPGGGYIYCATSDHTHWQRLTPIIVENYRTFVDIGRVYGGYNEAG